MWSVAPALDGTVVELLCWLAGFQEDYGVKFAYLPWTVNMKEK